MAIMWHTSKTATDPGDGIVKAFNAAEKIAEVMVRADAQTAQRDDMGGVMDAIKRVGDAVAALMNRHDDFAKRLDRLEGDRRDDRRDRRDRRDRSECYDDDDKRDDLAGKDPMTRRDQRARDDSSPYDEHSQTHWEGNEGSGSGSYEPGPGEDQPEPLASGDDRGDRRDYGRRDRRDRRDDRTVRDDAAEAENALAEEAQAWARVAEAHGLGSHMPLDGENLRTFRQKQCRRWQRFSDDWRTTNPHNLPDSALAVTAGRVRADAQAAARDPQYITEGTLKEIVKVDPYSGQRRIEWVGTPPTYDERARGYNTNVSGWRTAFEPFMQQRLRVTKFNKYPDGLLVHPAS